LIILSHNKFIDIKIIKSRHKTLGRKTEFKQ